MQRSLFGGGKMDLATSDAEILFNISALIVLVHCFHPPEDPMDASQSNDHFVLFTVQLVI